MSDLIDRKELLDYIDLCLAESDGNTPITDAVIVAIKCAVEQMPAVDVVKVVRCKDCKHSVFHRCAGEFVMISCKKSINLADETWFCADGERRENA